MLDLENPEQREGFETTCRALANMEDLRNDDEVARLLGEALEKPEISRTSSYGRVGRWVAAVAAVSAIVIALMTAMQTGKSGTENIKQYATSVGEQKTVELADGTVVTLNTGTVLLVDINDEVRRTILRRGEAFFDVVEDESRRFFVEVNNKSVSVLGTEFNLRKRTSGFVLSVAEGQVAIHPASEPVVPNASRITTDGTLNVDDSNQHRVTAGWIVEFDQAANALAVQRGETGSMSSWRTGVLNFVDTPLVAVVKELNRYGTKKILIEDPVVMNELVTATIRIDSINGALKGLALAHSLEITHNFDHIVIVGKP